MTNAAILLIGLGIFGARQHHAVAPIHDPALINIGMVCRWDRSCIYVQQAAMRRSMPNSQQKSPKLALCCAKIP